jgi:hypothetical protein
LRTRGLEIRIDHRSLEAQGIEREPTSHLGPAVSAMERRGMETEVGKCVGREMQAAAQGRLERGRLERSVLDLSGDLQAAQQERGQGPAASQAADVTHEESPAPVQKRGRFEGLQLGRGALKLSMHELGRGRGLSR